MCGIAGLISPRPVAPDRLLAMTGRIAHRGPDDEGIWFGDDGRLGLGLRRLAILDRSARGHQPMVSHDGRFVLAYNGEIYNHAALRRELDEAGPRAWRGRSDTETLLEAIAARGLKAALQASRGMFALALWDRRERTLSLARDRFGEKPLYYGWTGGDFVFASELKAISGLPRENGVSRPALAALLARGFIPAPLSIFEHVYKLEPGCVLTVGPEACGRRPDGPPAEGEGGPGPRLERYWSYRAVVEAGLADPIADPREARDMLEKLLADAVRDQAEADVPVGALLSGGVDSSLIVALSRGSGRAPLRTFTLGFDDPRFDEAGHAARIAAHFGTEHRERRVTVAEARAVIPLLPAMYDEPFADPSQIPTFLLSRFAREQVTVALGGDGGDELFGGYGHYRLAPRLWRRLRLLPPGLRSSLGRRLSRVSPAGWNRLARLVPSGLRPAHAGWKAHRWFDLMRAAGSEQALYAALLANPGGAAAVVGGAAWRDPEPGGEMPEAVRMMYRDALTYLPDDILCKVDRAAMAVGLEIRAPFLDHRVAALAARLPVAMKLGPQDGKPVLRELLARHAPPALFDRPKAGFGIPLDDWLRGPLRDWAEALLDARRLRDEGFVDPAAIRQQWDWHQQGIRDGAPALWPILMFQAWRDAAATTFAI